MINVGLIGIGKFGKNYIENINSINGVDILLVCSRNPESYNALRVRPNCIHRWTPSYEEVCSDPRIDVVIVATPPDSHYEIVKLALEKGKHVICEKPFVFDPIQALTLEGMAMDKKLGLVINYSQLWHPSYNEIYLKYRDDKSRSFISSIGSNWGPFRDYSSLWDYGSHDVAMVVNLFGRPGHICCHEHFKKDESGLEFSGSSYGINLESFRFTDGIAIITVGNRSLERYRNFSIHSEKNGLAYYSDNRDKNPLKIMLEDFFAHIKSGIPRSNAAVASEVTHILKKCEELIK